jgi:glycerophosphoryl diester phosphodiesterase
MPLSAILPVVLFCLAVCANFQAAAQNRPLIYGHRGSTLAPENSLQAFDAAIAAGADGIETDVFLSRDGKVYLLHDRTFSIRKCSSAQPGVLDVPAPSLTSSQIESIRCHFASGKGSKFEPAPVLELATLAKKLQSNNARLFVELKFYGGWDTPKAYIGDLSKKVCQILADAKISNRATIMAARPASLREYERQCPASPATCRIFSANRDQQLDRFEARSEACVAIHYDLATPETVSRLKGAGASIYVWTVNDRTTYETLRALGVTGIITNVPEAYSHQ